MGGRESSGVDAMIYSYMIIDNVVVELEGPRKVRFDRPGTNIDVIVKNKNCAESFPNMFQRKMKWLKENYPELLL
jgi:hypothetical protein